jgi:hypothetical protein
MSVEKQERVAHGLLTKQEMISLENDIHRINNNDLKEEILTGFGAEFEVRIQFEGQFADELVLNAYEFFSILIKCNINYSDWFYKQGAKYDKLINLRGEANLIEIIWEKKETVQEE